LRRSKYEEGFYAYRSISGHRHRWCISVDCCAGVCRPLRRATSQRPRSRSATGRRPTRGGRVVRTTPSPLGVWTPTQWRGRGWVPRPPRTAASMPRRVPPAPQTLGEGHIDPSRARGAPARGPCALQRGSPATRLRGAARGARRPHPRPSPPPAGPLAQSDNDPARLAPAVPRLLPPQASHHGCKGRWQSVYHRGPERRAAGPSPRVGPATLRPPLFAGGVAERLRVYQARCAQPRLSSPPYSSR
jgi:hypothetical protein